MSLTPVLGLTQLPLVPVAGRTISVCRLFPPRLDNLQTALPNLVALAVQTLTALFLSRPYETLNSGYPPTLEPESGLSRPFFLELRGKTNFPNAAVASL